MLVQIRFHFLEINSTCTGMAGKRCSQQMVIGVVQLKQVDTYWTTMHHKAYGTFNKTRDDLEFFLNSNSHADVDQNSVNKTINSFPRNTRIIFFKFLALRQTIFQEEHSLITLWLFGNGKKIQVVWLMTANNNLISRRWLMCVGSQDDDEDDARCVQKAL